MKRCLTKLVVFLLLGAIVNVAVAWGCAFSLTHYDQIRSGGKAEIWRGVLTENDEIRSTVWTIRRSGARKFVVEWSPNMGSTKLAAQDWDPEEVPPRWVRAIIVEHSLDSQFGSYLIIDARGWPILSFYSIADLNKSQVTHGLPLSDSSTSSRSWTDYSFALPIHPIRYGFVVNTVFFAAIAWLLWKSPFTARRIIRSKRGHCLKCAYDLRGTEHEVCPECGSEISVRAKS